MIQTTLKTGNGRRTSLVRVPNSKPDVWATVRFQLRGRGVWKANTLIDDFVALGFRPKFIEEMINGTRERAGGLGVLLKDLRSEDYQFWLANLAVRIREAGKHDGISEEKIRECLRRNGCPVDHEPPRPG